MSLQDTIKIPIAVLKIGELRSIQTNLEFADVVTFRLIEGNGPVYILGQHSPVTFEVEDVEELAEEETLSDEEVVSVTHAHSECVFVENFHFLFFFFI